MVETIMNNIKSTLMRWKKKDYGDFFNNVGKNVSNPDRDMPTSTGGSPRRLWKSKKTLYNIPLTEICLLLYAIPTTFLAVHFYTRLLIRNHPYVHAVQAYNINVSVLSPTWLISQYASTSINPS